MHKIIATITAASMVAGQFAATAAWAQASIQVQPADDRPTARPAPARPAPKPLPLPSRPVTKPAPKPPTAKPLPRPPAVRPPIERPTPLPAPVPPANPGPGWNGSGDSWGGGWGNNWNDWHGRIVRCESWNYRYARCNLDTRGGVRMVRQIAGDCRQGRTWGWDTGGNFVWVNRGCRADFQARYGNWGDGNDRPDNTGAVIAGVAVAAGLIAILAASGRKAEPVQTGNQPASISAPPGAVQAAAEPSFRRCLDEAARQVGATGGTAISVNGTVDTTPGNGGWRFQIPLESSWPNDRHATPAFCRATNNQVIELSFYQS